MNIPNIFIVNFYCLITVFNCLYYFASCTTWKMPTYVLSTRKEKRKFNRSQMEVFFPPEYDSPKHRPIEFVLCPYIRQGHINGILWDFTKALHLRSLTRFKYSLTYRVTSRYVLLYDTSYSEPCLLYQTYKCIIVNSDIFRHIHVLFKHMQPYCHIMCNSCIFRTQLNSESWHI